MFIPPTRFVTPDFILRWYLPGDGAQMVEAVNSSLDHLDQFLGWANPFETLESAETLVRGFYSSYLKSEDFLLSIWSPDEQELWGGTGFRLREGPIGSGNAEISMWIRANQAGKGLGTAVLEAMLQWGFTEWGFDRLCWRCRVDNYASARTAEKVGLTLEARLRRQHPDHKGGPHLDTLYYAILKEEWNE